MHRSLSLLLALGLLIAPTLNALSLNPFNWFDSDTPESISLASSADQAAAAAMLDKAHTLTTYTDVYTTMGMVTVGIGVALLLLSSPLNKMMHGVR